MNTGPKSLGDVILIALLIGAIFLILGAIDLYFTTLLAVKHALDHGTDWLYANHPGILNAIGWSICAILPVGWLVGKWRQRRTKLRPPR